MYTTQIAIENEKKNKKKSRMIAFFFALAIGAIAFVPMMSSITPDEPKYEAVVIVDFRDTKFEKASKKPSESGATGGKEIPKKVEEQPVTEVKPTPPKPPVVTTPKPNPPVKTTPKKVPTPPKPTKTNVPVVKPAKDPIPTPTEERVSTPDDAVSPKTDKKSGNGTGAGKTGNGKASESSDGDDVTPGDGDEGMDFSGDGIFGRRVTYRADVKKLTQEAGKIVVNLCVNREGRVVYAENNAELSTIKTPNLVNKTVQTAKRYRFDKDYTAANKECGKLTFIFELD